MDFAWNSGFESNFEFHQHPYNGRFKGQIQGHDRPAIRGG